MKTASPVLTTALKESDALFCTPRLTAEWNMNRYFGTVVDNTPSEDTDGYDIEMFPIDSITEHNRPGKGNMKARVGEGRISPAYAEGARPARFYVGSYDDVYKYWSSPYPSNSSGVLASCAPQVLYGNKTGGVMDYNAQTINKIVIGVENSWATPSAFTVQITTNGTDWITIGTQSTIGTAWEASGQIVLYCPNSGTNWTTTKPETVAPMYSTPIAGIKFTVTALKGGIQEDGTPTTYDKLNSNGGYDTFNTDGKNSYFSLIEISGRKEVDLTEYLIDVSDQFDMSDVSYLYPFGTVTTNTADISLWNPDNIFSKDNPDSPFVQILEPNVEMRLDYVYTVNNSKYVVPEFTMYTNVWSGQRDQQVSVNVDDKSKFFQETTPPAALWENLSVSEIVWRLCDSVGFSDYNIRLTDDRASDFIIPVFWTDGVKTLWEVFNELAIASQTAIYFDGHGTLQVRSRQNALNDTDAPVWTLLGQKRGNSLANMMDPQQATAYEANHVTVKYQTTKWSAANNGQPAMTKVWEPEDTVSLRASVLRKVLEKTDMKVFISTDDIRYWLFEGVVNVQGEYIRYEGKEYVYYTGALGATANTVTVKSEDERIRFNSKTLPRYQYKNHFTGALIVTERGLWNSENIRHGVVPENYSVRHIINGNHEVGVSGFTHLKDQSKVRLRSGSRFDHPNDLLVATIGNEADATFAHYGTRFRFIHDGKNKDQRAGIVINNNSNDEDGYYIELTLSSKLGGKESKVRNTLIAYSRKNGQETEIGPKRGAAVAIAEGIDYDIDVTFKVIGGDHNICVWVNGKKFLEGNVTGSNRSTPNGKFGIFTRRRTNTTYEYLYAIKTEDVTPLDDFSFLDKVTGGFVSDFWGRVWVSPGTHRAKSGSSKARLKFKNKFFDEFGPIVHEVREFNVKFDPMPVLHSRPYLTNDWSAALTEYNANPFGATFTIANTSRNNAVINGDDSLSYASIQREVHQMLAVYGRALDIADTEEVIAKSPTQIRRRGKIESELSSTWIQTKGMAKELSEWIRDQMTYGNDSITVEIFGNPLIELGDVVSIDYTLKDFNNTKYFVVGVSNAFNSGLSTTLTLRRVPVNAI